MKANLIFFFGLLFWANSAFCQIKIPKPLYSQIRFSTLALIDPQSPVFQAGAQGFFTERLAISVEAGIPFPFIYKSIFKDDWDPGDRYKAFKLRTEFKYLFKLKPNFKGFIGRNYLGLELFSTYLSFRDKDGYIYLDKESYHYEYSNLQKAIYGTCLKVGREVPYGSRLIVDTFIGMGARGVRIDHSPVGLIERPFPEAADLGGGPGINNEEGFFYRLHFALGLKLGYIIKSRL